MSAWQWHSGCHCDPVIMVQRVVFEWCSAVCHEGETPSRVPPSWWQSWRRCHCPVDFSSRGSSDVGACEPSDGTAVSRRRRWWQWWWVTERRCQHHDQPSTDALQTAHNTHHIAQCQNESHSNSASLCIAVCMVSALNTSRRTSGPCPRFILASDCIWPPVQTSWFLPHAGLHLATEHSRSQELERGTRYHPVSPPHHLFPHSGDSRRHFFSSDNGVNNTNYCVVVLKCLALSTTLILANWTESAVRQPDLARADGSATYREIREIILLLFGVFFLLLLDSSVLLVSLTASALSAIKICCSGKDVFTDFAVYANPNSSNNNIFCLLSP